MKLSKRQKGLGITFLTIAATVLLCLLLTNKSIFADAAQNGQAKILVSNYQVTNDAIVSGETFDLSLTVKNTSDTYAAEDITVSVVPREDAFYTVYGNSNQQYIDYLEPLEEQTITLKMQAETALNVQQVQADVTIDSYDQFVEGQVTNKALIIIPVKLDVMLQVKDFDFSRSTVVGTKARLQVRFENTGRKDLHNISLHITGDGLEEAYQIPIGDLHTGEESSKEVFFDFDQTGSKNMYFYFEYMDSSNATYTTVAQNFATNVTEIQFQNSVDQGQQRTIFLMQIVLFLTITGLISVIILMFIKRKK